MIYLYNIDLQLGGHFIPHSQDETSILSAAIACNDCIEQRLISPALLPFISGRNLSGLSHCLTHESEWPLSL